MALAHSRSSKKPVRKAMAVSMNLLTQFAVCLPAPSASSLLVQPIRRSGKRKTNNVSTIITFDFEVIMRNSPEYAAIPSDNHIIQPIQGSDLAVGFMPIASLTPHLRPYAIITSYGTAMDYTPLVPGFH